MFISFKEEIAYLIKSVVANPILHGRWLNTLSYLEHCGARKIAKAVGPPIVKEERLKHAAEEFRHAFYLKSQLQRIGQRLEDYRLTALLGGWASYHYLHALDLFAARHVNRHLSYLLVTYAIELRAGELYPLYQAALRQVKSKIQVQSILLEEKEHLQEMERELSLIPESERFIQVVCKEEARLCRRWLQACLSA